MRACSYLCLSGESSIKHTLYIVPTIKRTPTQYCCIKKNKLAEFLFSFKCFFFFKCVMKTKQKKTKQQITSQGTTDVSMLEVERTPVPQQKALMYRG